MYVCIMYLAVYIYNNSYNTLRRCSCGITAIIYTSTYMYLIDPNDVCKKWQKLNLHCHKVNIGFFIEVKGIPENTNIYTHNSHSYIIVHIKQINSDTGMTHFACSDGCRVMVFIVSGMNSDTMPCTIFLYNWNDMSSYNLWMYILTQ